LHVLWEGCPMAAQKDTESEEFLAFRRSYLIAFFCGSSADWLKGPYIYRLYEARGFVPEEITFLFAAGYTSSAIIGLVAGMMADAFGRRRMCLLFCFLYTVHGLLHVFESFTMLLCARAVSGVATALLFSAFEAWMVAEHRRRFESSDLAETFAVQTQGNAFVAIVSGLVAQGAVTVAGYAAPFMVATPLLASCAWQVARWPENLGSAVADTPTGRVWSVVSTAFSSMNTVVLRVGLMQCLFEGSMHVFVFLWTPCLQRSGYKVPHGLVFTVFMFCMFLGGRQSSSHSAFRPPLGFIFLISACSLLVPFVTENLWWNMGAFCSFEWCVGYYYPQIAMLRSRHISETSRNALITLFRMPLNVLVIATLVWGRARPAHVLLLSASGALTVAAAAYFTLPGSALVKVHGKGDDNTKAD